MSWSYTYDPNLWPALVSGAVMFFLGWYSWRHRNFPGARFLALGCWLMTIWVVGSILETAAINASAKVFWLKFQGIWQLPAVTAISCFVLEYSGLSRWLTRRTLILLAIPPLLFLLLVITNDFHHLAWTGFLTDQSISPVRGVANWVVVGYAYALGVLNVVIFLRLAFRSPQHRWPVVVMLFGNIAGLAIYLLNAFNAGLLTTSESLFLIFVFPFLSYGLALFGFHVFDPIPAARTSLIEQIPEGMLVLDLRGQVVDLNPAAAKILGERVERLRGRSASGLLASKLNIPDWPQKIERLPSEISLESSKTTRHYSLNVTTLMDRRSQVIGHLLLFSDVTEQKRTQKQILEQAQAMAALQERERLARELHDTTAQVLGYVNLQAETIRKWMKDGNIEKADSLLMRLSEVAKGAHNDVRESILKLKTGPADGWSFLPTLRQYLSDFQAQCGIRTELTLKDGLKEDIFKPDQEVQLLRVVQEALTNTRKHSGARNVRVTVDHGEGSGRITVTDDGIGFEPNCVNRAADLHFGLAFMNERMEQISGCMKIESHPGEGTVVKLEVPI